MGQSWFDSCTLCNDARNRAGHISLGLSFASFAL